MSKRKAAAKSQAAPTIAALATAIGVSPRLMAEYIARGCPKTSVAAVQEWRAAHVQQRTNSPGRDGATSHGAAPAGQSPPDTSRRADAELFKILEDVRGKKLKNDQLAGLLVVRAEAVKQGFELCQRLKARLEAFPDEIEMIFPVKVRAAGRREAAERIRLLLKEISEWQLT